MRNPRVTKQQIDEWTENPVTVVLKELYTKDLTRIQESPPTDCMIRGNPQASQENLIEQAARELEIVNVIDTLEGDWEKLEIDDDSDEVEDEANE